MRCKKGFIRAFGKPFKKKLHEIVSKKFKLSRVEKRDLSILFNKIQFTPELQKSMFRNAWKIYHWLPFKVT